MDYGCWNVSMTNVHTHALVVGGMVYCTECGREQADAAKFCRYCGDRMPGLELTTELKREAAAIQQSKSGTTNIPQQPPTNSQIPPNDQFRTGNRLGSV